MHCAFFIHERTESKWPGLAEGRVVIFSPDLTAILL